MKPEHTTNENISKHILYGKMNTLPEFYLFYKPASAHHNFAHTLATHTYMHINTHTADDLLILTDTFNEKRL